MDEGEGGGRRKVIASKGSRMDEQFCTEDEILHLTTPSRAMVFGGLRWLENGWDYRLC
jgi:hypothetical protein